MKKEVNNLDIEPVNESKLNEIEKYLFNLDFVRKPETFKEVGFENKSIDRIKLIGNFRIFTASQLGIKNPLDSFKWTPPIIFILKVRSVLYLIDTGGFSYCKYVLKISDNNN